MADRLNGLFTPVGRFISGSLTEFQSIDHEGNPIKEEDRDTYSFGVAIEKNAPGAADLINTIWRYAAEAYKADAGVMQQINQGLAGNFAFKIKDGDTARTKKGEPIPNAAGCFLIYFSTTLPIKTCNEHNVEIDPKNIKRGFYVDVSFNIKDNGTTGRTAGIYMNPQWVRFRYHGQEIVSGPTAEQAFAAATPNNYMPAGASTTPVGHAGMGAPGGGMPGNDAANAGMPPSGAPAGMPGAGNPYPSNNGMTATNTASHSSGMPGQNVQPHTAFVHGPQGGGMPGQMPQGGGMPGQMPQGGGMPGQMPQGGGMPGQMPQGGGIPGMGNG